MTMQLVFVVRSDNFTNYFDLSLVTKLLGAILGRKLLFYDAISNFTRKTDLKFRFRFIRGKVFYLL